MPLSDEQMKRRKESMKKYQQSEQGKKTRKTWTRKWEKTEKGRDSHKKAQRKYSKTEKAKKKSRRWAKTEKAKKATRKYIQSEKGKASTRKYNLSEKGLEAKKRYHQSEKGKTARAKAVRNWTGSEKAKIVMQRYHQSEKGKERDRKWQQENHEYLLGYKRKYRERHPVAHTKEMTKYRGSHRVCEWSYCDQIKPLHVHHILSQHKYPKYVDGNYHGRIANNFICFCPFHHFAYHFPYATTRNDKKHKSALGLLWFRTEKWADNNKISIEDVEIELAQMI